MSAAAMNSRLYGMRVIKLHSESPLIAADRAEPNAKRFWQ